MFSPAPCPLMLTPIAHAYSQGAHHSNSGQVLFSLCPFPRAPSGPACFYSKQSLTLTLFHSFALDEGPPYKVPALPTHCPHVSLRLTAVPQHSLADAHLLMLGLMHPPDFRLLWPPPVSPSKRRCIGCCCTGILTPPRGQMPFLSQF